MEEMKMVQFQGFMGDLVRRSEREEREGLSEGVGFYRSCAWHSTWVEFLGFIFFLFFLFFGRNNWAFMIGIGKFGTDPHFLYFSSFSRSFPHLLSFFESLKNKIQSNKNLKIIVIASIKQV